MTASKWRRFLPRRTEPVVARQSDDIFATAHATIAALKIKDFETLDREIERWKNMMDEGDAASWLTSLILQAPRAAHAQAMMDEHPHGYHDRTKRLYELIEFNDTFVSTVLLLPVKQLETFVEDLRAEIDAFCKKMYSRTFSDEQYEAITHGLSREIAVYRAAQHEGFNVLMASRASDAFGIDMQVQDPGSGRYVNIDCKTGSSFHFRLKDLVHERRLTQRDMDIAEDKGWWEITNRAKRSRKRARIILLRIDQDELGEIRDFGFVDDRVIRVKLQAIVDQRGLDDGQFGTDVIAGE